MKLFKQKGWGCEHRWTNRDGDRSCQKCLFHDWLWTRSSIGFFITVVFYFSTYPYWYFKFRNMDKRGFMKGEKNYKKE